MMKKLMVLSLVLVISAVSSAALSFAPTGDVPLAGSLQIDFKAGSGNLEGYDITLRVNSGEVVFTDAVLSTAGAWLTAPVFQTQTDSLLRITAGAFPGIGFAGLTVDDVLLVVSYVGVEGSVVEAFNNGANIGGQSVSGSLGQATLIPEPMTMGLLGLGALFLRRRK